MDKSQSAKVHRFVEALYDIESGKTIGPIYHVPRP